MDMRSFEDRFTLKNGVQMPCMGLGTWQTDGDTTVKAIQSALEAGYRLIDTAAAYGNEASVGRAIAQSGIAREKVFVTSKLRNACHGYRATMDAFELTMKRLGFEYLDLYLIHWPNPLQYRTVWKEALLGTWRAFLELYNAGAVRAIGVSNFLPHHIELLQEASGVSPMVNQLKLCPGITQPEAVSYCEKNGIQVEAYSPFGTGGIFTSPEMRDIAARYGKTVGQICLRWCIQNRFLPLPKSGNPQRIRENMQVFDFSLSPEDMFAISSLTGYCGQAPVPDEIRF